MYIASDTDISHMRAAGQLAARLLSYLQSHLAPGVTTAHIDRLAAEWTAQHGAISAPLNYKGRNSTPFPYHICTSVNEVVCHGYPNDIPLKSGDIINIDVTPALHGYHGDTSATFPVGAISTDHQRLIQLTQECLSLGIAQCRPGAYIGDIGAAIQAHAVAHNHKIIKEFVGHGIGKTFHQPPFIPHVGHPNTGIRMVPGMIFTIEPILTASSPKIHFRNEWEAITADGSYTAQAEHTVLITATGHEILTA